MTWIINHKKLVLHLLVAVAIAIGGYFLWQHFHQPQPVTAESQAQAEIPAGVSLAAHNAKVGMMQEQLDSATQQIAELKNKPPDTIIKTVPVEVTKIVTQEVEKRGADFAIVTDPNNPDKKVDLKEVAKLPENTDVTLNQYNVFAYKKVIRDITVYPSFSGIIPNGISEVDYGVSRKITNDGKYLGVVGGYDFDSKKTKVGLRIAY
jgi:Tfp pilus assembly protein PilO